MKNIVIILLVGCVVLMMWKISDNQPPSISSNSEVVPQKIKRPVEKKIIRLEKKQNHTPIPVPKSINLKKNIQKIDDEEEAPWSKERSQHMSQQRNQPHRQHAQNHYDCQKRTLQIPHDDPSRSKP